jgi:hypothetical protein
LVDIYHLVESDYLTVLDEWEVPRDKVSVTSTSLGSGQFGIVKKGTFRTNDENGEDIDLTVAVKFLKGKSVVDDCVSQCDFTAESVTIVGLCTAELSTFFSMPVKN